ncbi:FkbM family methyltransferase [Mesorhizobium sp.]|uniref:FkbM family methyltransferase n=1 Tax=Mesorhizobium sp. TaxID=1871066 RepID=UPI000FE6118D|nr:FkbM family methyltransferase [Mesorhizobium sp.]RWO92493.1 MAG: FkbM family methyltransferase [Mesorhizobium sp.]RWQ58619.1 MAG: FkbM family methyltransferase [Mesorhizobium sp.]TIL68272.1 MAG: FkbM family methyltransferase [Mesorhizobium sp.]
MQKDLIFDLGMHDGSDTDFYLRKGFRVVAVEADTELIKAAKLRFANAISEKRLTLVNKAVAEACGTVKFYRSKNTLWSTVSARNSALSARKGAPTVELEVEATTSTELLREFGVPYYLKIDIEGLDLTALAGLASIDERPRFVSIESARRDLQDIRAELEAFVAVGYDRFKVVAQHKVHLQKEPNPPREGIAGGIPVPESSGLFGEDLPGRWLTQQEAVDAYRRPLLNHYLTGNSSLIKNRWLRAALKRLGFRAGWYDTHGKFADRSRAQARV